MINYDRLFNKEYYSKSIAVDHFVDKKLSYEILPNAKILPYRPLNVNGNFAYGGGIVDGEGNFIKSSSVHTGFGVAYSKELNNIRGGQHYNDSTVIYFGMIYPIWGHIITDGLRRFWFLQSEVYKKNFQNCPIVYIPMGNYHPNFYRLLNILGVDFNKFIPITEITQFKNIILPDESFFTFEGKPRFFTSEYVEMIDQIRNFAVKNQKSTPFKKVYFFHGQKQIGEQRLANYFQSKGYVVIQPEQLTIEDQLNVLINCESFASTVGSCSHNLIFLKDHTEVILIPRAYFLPGYQLALDQIHDLNINYMDSSLSLFLRIPDPWEGIFYYRISDQLKNFFGDKSTEKFNEEDFKTFAEYILLAFQMKRPFNQEAFKYYGDIAKEFMDHLKNQKELLSSYGIKIN